MSVNDLTLEQLKQSIDEFSREVLPGRRSSKLLEDLKRSVDHLRLSLWAIIQFEEQCREQAGAQPGLSAKLAEFRLQRLCQMLNDFRVDMEKGALTALTPEVRALSDDLRATLDKISRFFPNRQQ